jgi:PAS domain S-box-containing protein
MAPLERPALEEELERLKETNEALWAIFGLGHALAQADTPEAMVAAVHGVARRVLPVTLTGLALKGPEEVRLFLCGEGGTARSLAVSIERWSALFAVEEPSFLPGDGLSKGLAEILGREPLPGMARSLGDPPAAWLLALGPRPFEDREAGLLARIGDFLFSALARWERLEGALRKSRQVADLFVLLAQEKERLDNVVRSVPVGLLLLDRGGNIHLANDAAAKALGLSPVEVRENKVFAGRPAGRVLLGLLDKVRAEGKTVSTPYEMEGRWFQVQVVPWPGMTLFLVVTQDIQEWYGLNRLKEDLISIISHEVKNPLSAIVNAADLLAGGRPGPLNEPQARLAALILENARNIRGILDDVVRLSRLHHLKGEAERVPVKALIERIRDGHRDTLQGKLLTWREELEEVHLLCDAGMLENLLANLIGNAVKYAPIGGTVGVRLRRDGERVALRVLDDGPGIPPAERDRLFTPFFRASNVRNLVAGTGLGLVIARNVAERLGGRLDCTSPLTEEDRLFLGPASAARPGTAFEAVFPFTP